MSRKKKEVQVEDPFNYGGLISFLCVFILIYFSITKTGMVGLFINNLFSYLFGPYYLTLLITLFICAFIKVFLSHKYKFNVWFYIGITILNIAVMLMSTVMFYGKLDDFPFTIIMTALGYIKQLTAENVIFGGGLVGTLLMFLTMLAFDYAGTLVILVLLYVIAAILIIPLGVFKVALKNVKDSSTRVKQKVNAYSKERKIAKELYYAQKQQEQKFDELNRIIKESQEAKLRDDIKNIFNDESFSYNQLQIPVEDKKEKEIEVVKNTSEFSKNFFIDDEPINKQEIKEVVEEESQPVINKDIEITPVKESRDSNPIEFNTQTKKNGKYHLPPESILSKNTNSKASNMNKTSAEIKGKKLIEILANFGVEANLTNTYIGPSVTKFEIVPDQNVKVNKINGLSDNIKMGLAAKDVRIEAPIPGRSAVGVEIPNAEMTMVRMSELLNGKKFKDTSKKLVFTLGKDLLGEPVYCELNKMPHLLVAGATGSGKSVCMNTIITSFLLRSNPKDLKLVLVDPKKVEFTPYHDIPHLLWPVITDSTMASMMLKKAVVIMEERYDAFAEVGVRDIVTFNEFVNKHNANLKEGESPMQTLPYIVIIIDELADLMVIAKKEVESSIQRITQLSRACGMHLIVATQRPSTDVITGLIKSNIPSRISFAVSSSIDSRTILDQTGAEKLLGHGDMLYFPQGESGPTRVQGCYVTDEEIKKITDYCKKQADPEYDDTYFEIKRNLEGDTSFQFTSESGKDKDALYDEVVEFVVDQQKASTSLLQRRFGIGYNRSARIIDELEKNGVIGPSNGSKPREVYKKRDGE